MSAIVSAGCCCNQQIPPCTARLLQHQCYERLHVSLAIRMDYQGLRDAVAYQRPCQTWNGEVGPCICPAQVHVLFTGGYEFELIGEVRRSSCGTGWSSGPGSQMPRWAFSSWQTEYLNCRPYWECQRYGFHKSIQASGQGIGGGLSVGCCYEPENGFATCVPCNLDDMSPIPNMWQVRGTIGNAAGFQSIPVVVDGSASYRFCNGDAESYQAYAGISGTFQIQKIASCNNVLRAPWGNYGGCAPWKTRFDAEVNTGFSIEEQGQTVYAGAHPDRLGTSGPTGFIAGPEPHCEPKPTQTSRRQWRYQALGLPYDTIHVVGTRTIFARVTPIP